MSDIQLVPYTATDHDWLVARLQTRYAVDKGFDASFGPLVDEIQREFERNEAAVGSADWIARDKAQRLGSIFCVRVDDQTAKLRMFVLVPKARGRGIGKLLLEQCMGFARDRGYRKMTLWTHESHVAACALYTRFGWSCVSSKPVVSFGVALIEQQWEITL